MNKILMILAALITGLSANAQNEITGNWKREAFTVVSGKATQQMVPDSLSISASTKDIFFSKGYIYDDGKDLIEETLSLDGKPNELAGNSGNKKNLSIKKDGGKWMLSTIVSDAEGKKMVNRLETWYIEGGKLVLLRKDNLLYNGESWEAKVVYTKK